MKTHKQDYKSAHDRHTNKTNKYACIKCWYFCVDLSVVVVFVPSGGG